MSEATDSTAWSPRTRLLATLFLLAVWALGLMLLAGGDTLGWLPTLLAAWMSAGLAFTAARQSWRVRA